jgi:predicted RNA methylase
MLSIRESLAYKVLKEIYLWFFEYFIRPFRDLVYRIRIVTDEHLWERRLNIKTTGDSPVRKDMTKFGDSYDYAPIPYHVIKVILDQEPFGPGDVFVDLGCGKGRAILIFATKKFKKVIGIEMRKDMFDTAIENLERSKGKNTPVEIINADVAVFDMQEGTVFFMFNPFGFDTQEYIIKNIKGSLIVNPRQVKIIHVYGSNASAIDDFGNFLDHEKRYSFFRSLKVDVWRFK